MDCAERQKIIAREHARRPLGQRQQSSRRLKSALGSEICVDQVIATVRDSGLTQCALEAEDALLADDQIAGTRDRGNMAVSEIEICLAGSSSELHRIRLYPCR